MRINARLLCVTLALASFVLPARAQDSDHKLLLDTRSGEPVSVEKTHVDPDDLYYTTLSLTVRNGSTKQICFVEYALTLPEVKTSGNTMVLTYRYGTDPSKADKPNDKPLKIGKTASVKVVDDGTKMIAARMNTAGHRSPGAAVLKLRTVCFDDGTRWQDGKIVAGAAAQTARN